MSLGLIAGGGDIPRLIAEHRVANGEPVFVIGIKGFVEPWVSDFPHEMCGIAETGRMLKALKAANCDTVSLIGIVKRPDFSKLKPDFKAVTLLPRIIKAATKGDDALIRSVVSIFEDEGLKVVGAETLLDDIRSVVGSLSARPLSEEDKQDIQHCYEIAGEIGRLDIGQGAVVARGLVLAVEAQEGTDEMLRRITKLPEEIRGTENERCGVLLKRPKPMQERRVDLPTIGPSTIRLAAEAGLSSVVFLEDGALIVEKDEIIRLANAFGMSVVGLTKDGKLP